MSEHFRTKNPVLHLRAETNMSYYELYETSYGDGVRAVDVAQRNNIRMMIDDILDNYDNVIKDESITDVVHGGMQFRSGFVVMHPDEYKRLKAIEKTVEIFKGDMISE